MKMTVYVPDDLAAEVKAELGGDTNISAICQRALRAELVRTRTRARIGAEGFGRVEAYDREADRTVAFQGREVGDEHERSRIVYVTPKNGLVLVDRGIDTFHVHANFADFAANWGGRLAAEVAAVLGEKYVEELDI